MPPFGRHQTGNLLVKSIGLRQLSKITTSSFLIKVIMNLKRKGLGVRNNSGLTITVKDLVRQFQVITDYIVLKLGKRLDGRPKIGRGRCIPSFATLKDLKKLYGREDKNR